MNCTVNLEVGGVLDEKPLNAERQCGRGCMF